MEKEKLLKEARREFQYEFKIPQEESYFPVAEVYDGTVIFAAEKKAADAFIRDRKISGRMDMWLLAVTVVALLFVVWQIWSRDIERAFMNTCCIILGFLFIWVVGWLLCCFRRRKLKRAYRYKVILYLPYFKRSGFQEY